MSDAVVLSVREPVSEREMEKTKFSGNNTICQTLRDIYALIGVDDEAAKLKLRLAMAMGKAMDNKLVEYKKESARWRR
jgi:hypothetical protein